MRETHLDLHRLPSAPSSDPDVRALAARRLAELRAMLAQPGAAKDKKKFAEYMQTMTNELLGIEPKTLKVIAKHIAEEPIEALKPQKPSSDNLTKLRSMRESLLLQEDWQTENTSAPHSIKPLINKAASLASHPEQRDVRSALDRSVARSAVADDLSPTPSSRHKSFQEESFRRRLAEAQIPTEQERSFESGAQVAASSFSYVRSAAQAVDHLIVSEAAQSTSPAHLDSAVIYATATSRNSEAHERSQSPLLNSTEADESRVECTSVDEGSAAEESSIDSDEISPTRVDQEIVEGDAGESKTCLNGTSSILITVPEMYPAPRVTPMTAFFENNIDIARLLEKPVMDSSRRKADSTVDVVDLSAMSLQRLKELTGHY